MADPASYRTLLAGFAGFYGPLEPLIARAGLARWGYDAAARRKSGWLAADLAALSCPAEPPICADLPSAATPSRAFGCAYVLEGATLGGRHISRLLEASAVPPDARRFFASYGRDTGARWREFCAALEAFAATAGETGEILAAAAETFTSLSAWLGTQLSRS